MPKPKGSKLVNCRSKHANYLLPGTKRLCNTQGCRRQVEAPKAAKQVKTVAAKVKTKAKKTKPKAKKVAKSKKVTKKKTKAKKA